MAESLLGEYIGNRPRERPEEEEEERPKLDLDLVSPPRTRPAAPDGDDTGSVLGSYVGEQYTRDQLRRAGGDNITVEEDDPSALDQISDRYVRQQRIAQTDFVPIPDPLSDEEIQIMQESPMETAVRSTVDFLWDDVFGNLETGVRIGAQGLYERLDNLADVVSHYTGLPETELFEWLAKDVAPTDTPKELHEKVIAGLGAAMVEVPQWAIALSAGGAGGATLFSRLGLVGNVGKMLGRNAGAGALGALTYGDEGGWAAARGAAEFMLLNGVLQSTASLTKPARMGTMATVFGGQAAVNGEDTIDIAASAMTGAVLGAMGKGGDVRMADVIKGRLVRDSTLRDVFNAWKKLEKGARVDIELANKGAMRYLKKYHPTVYERLQAESVGKPHIKMTADGAPAQADAFIKQLNAHMGLKAKVKEGSALGLRERMEMIFDQADPKRRVPAKERLSILDQLQADVENANASLNSAYAAKTSTPTKGKQAKKAATKQEGSTARKTALEVRAEREASARRFENLSEKWNEATDRAHQTVKQRLLKAPRAFVEGVLDTSVSARKALTEMARKGNKAAYYTLASRDLIAGYAARGAMYYQEAKRNIFQLERWFEHPSKEFETQLRSVVTARKLIDIAKRKEADAHNIAGGEQSFRDAVSYYRNLSERLGPKKARALDAAADRYFLEYRRIAKRLLDEGLISKKSFENFANIDYNPTEYLARLDPKATSVQGFLQPSKISVGESGVKILEGGSKSLHNVDIMGLLQQSIIRAEGRIARNRANRTLLDLAKTPEGKQLIRTKGVQPKGMKLTHDKEGRLEQWEQIKAPENFEKISVFVNGKQKPLFLHKAFARGWADVPPAMAPSLSTMLRVASGSSIVRPLATGFNPFFALTNFPRDIVHAMIVSQNYSAFLPKAVGQMTRDLWVTRKDAFGPKDQGRLRQYLEEGGGMNFLTHQGTDILGARHEGGRPFETRSPRWENVKVAMSKMNEVSELWVRLAVRERALRKLTNGRPAQATRKARELATWEARNYLDFSQGGRAVKGMDHAFPYLNASMQATRTVMRSAKENPWRFAAMLGQLALVDGVTRYIAAQQNPEAYAQIPPRDKRRSIIFNTDLSYVDPRGNTRWAYVTMPIDPSIAFFLAPTRWAIDRELFGLTPLPHEVSYFEEQWESFKEFNPFLTEQGIPLPPTLEAFVTGATNKDLFFDKEVWSGPEVPYESEVLEPGSLGKPTPALSRYLAEALSGMGMRDSFLASPERMDAMLRKVVPNHVFVMGADWLANELRYGDEDLYKEMQTETEQWLNSPGVRRVVSVTHPAEVTVEALSDAGKDANAVSLQQNHKLDNMAEEMFQGKTSRRDILQWLKNDEGLLFSDKKRLSERLEDKIELKKMFGTAESNKMPGKLPQNWWLNLKRLPADERAEVFWKYWKQQPANEKRRMWRAAMALRYHKDRYGEFLQRFKQLREQGGDHEED